MKQLIYLSPVPWSSFAQRPHKFVQWFHQRTGGAVMWLEPYPTRLPQLSDIRRLFSSPMPPLSSQQPAWLTVLKPRALPIEPLPGSQYLNRLLWQELISQITTFTETNETLFAFGKPSVLALSLLDRFPHCPSLYDAMDDFPAFYSGYSRLIQTKREQQIVQAVGTLWASSSELLKRWNGHCDNIHLVYNGLDVSVLPTLKKPSRPAGQKIFGYVGTLADWFDWEWLFALATARPNDEIRLIGPQLTPAPKNLPINITMLPACAHDAALKAMLDFDVGLIPFKRNALTASVDPIKYYEYRALSLPVISTDFGEMRCRKTLTGTFISQSTTDIASLAERALQHVRNADLAHAFAAENSWETRFDGAGLLP
ncbi:MAG TPA: glycosyl transferase [Pseudomonadales bacterium]|nr:glycosyl transferase [Pseudomonadales bacterium]